MQFNLGISGININEWKKVIYGLILSAILGFMFGYIITKIIEKVCKKLDRRKTTKFFKKTQILGGGAMAFMHGAQDGQKFIGIFLLGISLANGITNTRNIRSSYLVNVIMFNCNDTWNFNWWI